MPLERDERSGRRHMGSLCKPYRIALILALAALSSAWTCTAIVNLNSCQTATPLPTIATVSPNPISASTYSEVLIVEGSNFLPQSQILWNQYPLPTTFIDSGHLKTTITQETFSSYGGSAGKNVLITVASPGNTSVVGCPAGGNSSTLLVEIT